MKTFGIFAKQPVSGFVKTRLAADWGPDAAAHLYEAFLRDLAERFRGTGERRVMGFAPVHAEAWFQSQFGACFDLWPQPETGLGERITRFFQRYLQGPDDCAVLIGSDSPTLPEVFVEQAFDLLQTKDCVLGPATDGGYYLIGLRWHATAFDSLCSGIEWSTSTVLSQTVDRVRELNWSLGLLPVWYDIDTLNNTHLLRGHLKAMALAQQDADANKSSPTDSASVVSCLMATTAFFKL